MNEIQRILELAGLIDEDAALLDQPNAAQQDQSDSGWAIAISGTLGRDIWATKMWEALETVFPEDYARADYQQQDTQDTPQRRVMKSLQRAKTAVIKMGLPSRDRAEQLATRFSQLSDIARQRVQVIEQD